MVYKSLSVAGQKKNEIVTELKSQLNDIAYFKNNVFKSRKTKVKNQKAILIHLLKDTSPRRTTEEYIHYLTIHILMKDISDIKADQEEEIEKFIDRVGLIEDKLKSITNNTYWEDLEQNEVDYKFGSDGPVVWYNALFTVTVRKEW
jgi:endonuclease III